jgi:hypothetical protein
MDPTIAYNPAPPVNPLDQQARILAIKNLMGQGQVQQQQIQSGALANQQAQMDVDSQRAFQRAYTEANGDPDKTTQLAAKYGAKPKDLLLWQGSVIDQKMKTLDLVQKQGDQAKIQADLMQGAHDAVAQAPPEAKPVVYQQALMGLKQRGIDTSQLPPQYPGDQAFAMIGATVKTHTQMVDEMSKLAEQHKNQEQGNLAATDNQIKQQQLNAIKGTGVVPGLSPDEQGLISYMRSVPGAKPENYSAWKAAQEARATQPYKIETARAEAQTAQLIKGMSDPVYGVDPRTGQKTLMSKTDALQSGIRTMMPVTEKTVSDDTMLINRLSDVRQKIARYEQSLQQPLSGHGAFSQSDQTILAQVLGDDKFKAGAFGTELPVDWTNKLGQKYNLEKLSPAAQKRLVAYYNAREAMVGYQRVLSGSGRSSEQAMNLNLQTLPNPIAPDDYAKESLGQFKENLQIVGQGLPNIPGIKTPEQWENEVTQPRSQRDPRKFPAPIPLSSLLGQ